MAEAAAKHDNAGESKRQRLPGSSPPRSKHDRMTSVRKANSIATAQEAATRTAAPAAGTSAAAAGLGKQVLKPFGVLGTISVEPHDGDDHDKWKPDRSGRMRKLCFKKGCASMVAARGLCVKHGGRGTCSAVGCTTNAATRGLCAKHGAYGICTVDGCTTNAFARGLCRKHGGTGICTVDGCGKHVHVRGLCYKHGRNEN